MTRQDGSGGKHRGGPSLAPPPGSGCNGAMADASSDPCREDRSPALRFPPGLGSAAPWRAAGVRGVRYGATTSEQDELFAGWVARGHARPHAELKTDVFAAGELCAKFFDPPSLVRRLSDHATAHRAARLALDIAPLPTPRPLLAVGGVGPQGRRSLLVTELVRGVSLNEAWGADARARGALPALVASMHAHGVHHGDLHPANLLWDGERLFVIDVTALRRGLHRLFPRRLAVGQWARLLLHLADVEGVREAHRTYVALRGRDDAEASWQRVIAHARRLLRRRTSPLPGAPELP